MPTTRNIINDNKNNKLSLFMVLLLPIYYSYVEIIKERT
jgi:hypothetical protein